MGQAESLNPSQGEIYMVNAWKAGFDTAAQFLGASLKLGAAVAFDFFPKGEPDW